MTLATGATSDGFDAPAVSDGERELKFTLSGGRVDLARRWLDALCRRDPKYPAAHVWTIYYDMPRLTSLGEKINSDYLKLKVRLRWYSELGSSASGPAFVEAKLRVGARRAKVRVVAPYRAQDLASWDLQDARLKTLPLLLRAKGVALREGGWHPLMLVRYRRDRFVEPITAMRISLDAEIAAVAVNRRWISTIDSSAIGLAILEAKGGGGELPAPLRPLLQMGARKCAFSKFAALYGHATHTIW